MYTELAIRTKKLFELLAFSNLIQGNKNSNAKVTSGRTYGGFTDQDWINVGNDIRRGILEYGSSKDR